MAYPEMLGDVPGNEEQTARNREIREFFTFRPGQPVYNKGPERPDHWGWLEIYPQHGFAYDEQSGKYEQMTVGVAQNWSAERGLTAMNAPNMFGRSYTHQPIEKRNDAVNWGYNFQDFSDYTFFALSQNKFLLFNHILNYSCFCHCLFYILDSYYI